MRIVAVIATLLLSAAPAMAANLCQAVTAAHSLQYLLDEKSGGIVQMTRPAAFPEAVTGFVVKTDPSFQDQKFEIFPLGGGAGLAVHYEGSEAEQYTMMFDRVGGALKAVEIPNLNPEADSYLGLYPATIGGVPALFLNNEKPEGTITRIAPWQNHKWGAVCELKSPAK